MLGLVCMLDGKGMKKGINSIKNIDEKKLKEASMFNLNYTLHPDQFVVLNSDWENVIENSLEILRQQSAIAQLGGQHL